MNIAEHVEYYIELGYKPVPLAKNTKRPFIKNYLEKPVDELWADCRDDYNVGLQCGINGLICFDADNEHTKNKLQVLLEVYQPWIVQTKNGYHFWLKTDVNDWGNTVKVMSDPYKGEIRLQGCQTVVPPSKVDGWFYRTERGDISNIGYMPKEMVAILISTLTKNTNESKPKVESVTTNEGLEINHLLIKMPRIEWTKVKNLVTKINWLRNADSGDDLTIEDSPNKKRHYKSRSEVFQSVIYTLMRYGYTEDEIVEICKNEGINYQSTFYYHLGIALKKAYSKLISDPNRITLQKLYSVDRNYKHINDELVYKFILARAMQFDTFNVKLYKADVMKFTAIGNSQSITNSLKRLSNAGLITFSSRNGVKVVRVLNASTDMCVYLPSTSVQHTDDSELHLDLISHKILKNSMKTMKTLVGEEYGLSPKNIIDLTNQPRQTVYDHLKKLIKLNLVEKINELYYLHPDWKLNLYEIASDKFNENHLRLTKQRERFSQMKNTKELYEHLKTIMPQTEALVLIKEYEQNGFDLDIIKRKIKGENHVKTN